MTVAQSSHTVPFKTSSPSMYNSKCPLVNVLLKIFCNVSIVNVFPSYTTVLSCIILCVIPVLACMFLLLSLMLTGTLLSKTL